MLNKIISGITSDVLVNKNKDEGIKEIYKKVIFFFL